MYYFMSFKQNIFYFFSLIGDRLSKFTKKQSKLVNRLFDFLGLNYNTANYAAYSDNSKAKNASYITNSQANCGHPPHDNAHLEGVLEGEKKDVFENFLLKIKGFEE